MKEAFLTRLESSLAKRVIEHAEVFDSNSAFLRLVVRVFFKFMDAGIIRLDLVWLQAVLRENPENLRNRVASAARSEVAEGLPCKATRLPQPTSISRHSAAKAVEVVAWSYPHFLPSPNKNLGLGIVTP